MDPKIFDEAETLLQARGTPAARLQEVVGAFEGLARKGDDDAAAEILARLDGRLKKGEPMTDEIRASLNEEKIGVISHGISSIRRGSSWDLVMTSIAAAAGFTLGFVSHRVLDSSLNATAGLAGVAAGVALDTTLTNRNILFTGGASFAVGSALHTLTKSSNGIAPVKVEGFEV